MSAIMRKPLSWRPVSRSSLERSSSAPLPPLDVVQLRLQPSDISEPVPCKQPPPEPVEATATPVNYAPPDPANIDRDVAYALQVVRNTLIHLESMGVRLEGAAVLELGPGFEFGPQLIYASYGARVTVADRFLARWDNNYHPTFYRALRAQWDGPASALDRVIAECGYPSSIISCLEEPAETLHSLQDASFDIVISNAVLEHVEDMSAVVRALARVTRIGGQHSHQVDFRDHRNFDRPLEFLLMSDEDFAHLAHREQMQCGNRMRVSQVEKHFRDAGFVIESTDRSANDPAYVAAFLPRLRSSGSSFRNTAISDLECGSARFVLRRTA